MNVPPDREIIVFNEALQLPPAERAAFLDEACAGDAELRARVEDLLQAHIRAGSFLQESATGVTPFRTSPKREAPSSSARLPDPFVERAGDRIGRYKLLQQIGEGGCGVVYMAEQEEPVRRRVALKVIKLGMDTK